MPELVYTINTSLDGYIEDADGNLNWSEPDVEVFRFITELEKPAGTYLYGRRMYEAMRYWDTPDPERSPEPHIREFTDMWRAADKIVYSRSPAELSGPRTRLERDFDADAVRRLKADADRRLTIGGASLAAVALWAGLVDEIRLIVVPIVLGGGRPWCGAAGRIPLRLLETRRFASGAVYLRYAVTAGSAGGA